MDAAEDTQLNNYTHVPTKDRQNEEDLVME